NVMVVNKRNELVLGNEATAVVAASKFEANAGITLGDGSITEKAGNYKLKAEDDGKVITLNNSVASTIIISSGLRIAFTASIIQIGKGDINVSTDGPVINSYGGRTTLAGQYARVSIICYAANVCNLSGDLR